MDRSHLHHTFGKLPIGGTFYLRNDVDGALLRKVSAKKFKVVESRDSYSKSLEFPARSDMRIEYEGNRWDDEKEKARAAQPQWYDKNKSRVRTHARRVPSGRTTVGTHLRTRNRTNTPGGMIDIMAIGRRGEVVGKLAGMRKPQGFVVYPARAGDTTLRVQSDKSIGEFDVHTGAGRLCTKGDSFMHLSMKSVPYQFPPEFVARAREIAGV